MVVMTGQPGSRDSSALSCKKCCWSSGRSTSAKMALAGHSGTQIPQSTQPSGSMTRKLGPSWKQSTGQTDTQSVYLQRMQDSVTTKVMWGSRVMVAQAACVWLTGVT